MIKKIFIKNYKIFEEFDLELNNDLNIIVGDNEAGKSTVLEAINLALTKRLNGRLLEYELTPYLFNGKCVDAYLKSLKTDEPEQPPEIVIELYLDDIPEFAELRGRNNSKKEDRKGIKIKVTFDEDYRKEYENLLTSHSPDDIELIPAEYYKVSWLSFADNALTLRGLNNIRVSYIDATTIRLQSGTDYYLQDIIKTDLDVKERVGLNVAYRRLKEAFSQEGPIAGINKNLKSKKGVITDKDLSISIDISQRSNWETNLIPHLENLPFQFVGKGEQSALKIMLALERKADQARIILIEEPENHLSYSSMTKLIKKIRDKCAGNQIVIATHSAYVLNKLGLDKLILLTNLGSTTLTNLSADTQNYFKKLPGYDTLRLVLAKKAILVEGSSDELIVQRAYFDKFKRLPIDDGVDVISVRGLSFARFLDIAKEAKNEVVVVTDNDGDYEKKVDKKYKQYRELPNIKICRSEDNSARTLETQIIKVNGFASLNKILNTSYQTTDDLEKYMKDNKTECALKIFDTGEVIKFPEYIQNAVWIK